MNQDESHPHRKIFLLHYSLYPPPSPSFSLSPHTPLSLIHPHPRTFIHFADKSPPRSIPNLVKSPGKCGGNVTTCNAGLGGRGRGRRARNARDICADFDASEP